MRQGSGSVQELRRLHEKLRSSTMQLWWRNLVCFVQEAERLIDAPAIELGQDGFIWDERHAPLEPELYGKRALASMRWFLRDPLPARVEPGNYAPEGHALARARKGEILAKDWEERRQYLVQLYLDPVLELAELEAQDPVLPITHPPHASPPETAIIDVLTRAYPKKTNIEVLLQRIGVPVAEVDIDGTAREAWHRTWAAVSRAGQGEALWVEVLSDESIAAYHTELRQLKDRTPQVRTSSTTRPADSTERADRVLTAMKAHGMSRASEEVQEPDGSRRFRTCDWPPPSYADPDGFHEIHLHSVEGPGDCTASGTTKADIIRSNAEVLELSYSFGAQRGWKHLPPFRVQRGDIVTVYGERYHGALPFYPKRGDVVVLRSSRYELDAVRCVTDESNCGMNEKLSFQAQEDTSREVTASDTKDSQPWNDPRLTVSLTVIMRIDADGNAQEYWLFDVTNTSAESVNLQGDQIGVKVVRTDTEVCDLQAVSDGRWEDPPIQGALYRCGPLQWEVAVPMRGVLAPGESRRAGALLICSRRARRVGGLWYLSEPIFETAAPVETQIHIVWPVCGRLQGVPGMAISNRSSAKFNTFRRSERLEMIWEPDESGRASADGDSVHKMLEEAEATFSQPRLHG